MYSMVSSKGIASPIIAAIVLSCSVAYAHRDVRHHAVKHHAATCNLAPIEDVSLIQLIANSQKYSGQRVRLVGFVRIEFEGNAVYLHQEDDEHCISANALALALPERMTAQAYARYRAVSGKYAIIEGTFDSQDHGNMGLFSGTIESITPCQTWLDRSDIQKIIRPK